MKTNNRILNLVVTMMPFVLALALFVVMFFNAAVLKNNDGDIVGQYSGLKVAFGFTQNGVLADLVIKFNFLLVLTYCLPLIISIIIVVLGILKKDKLASIFAIALTVSFVLSAIGLFTITNSTNVYTVTGIGTIFNSLADLGYNLSALSIIGAVLSLSAATFSLAQIVLGFIKK